MKRGFAGADKRVVPSISGSMQTATVATQWDRTIRLQVCSAPLLIAAITQAARAHRTFLIITPIIITAAAG